MTVGLGMVPAPQAEPPIVGLIPALGTPGGPYLDPPDTFEDGTPDQRWEEGFEYLPEHVCGGGGTFDPCNGTPGLTVQGNPSTVQAMPFGIFTGDKCSTSGWEAHDFAGRATRALLAVESKLIAQEFWTGTQVQAAGFPNRYLSSLLSDTLTNGPVTPQQALSYLEMGLADCGNGQQGAIHCTREFASAISALGNTVRLVNGLIITYLGTIIIPDAGYDGSGPGGTPRVSGSQWAYATLIPQVRRSEIMVTPDGISEALLRTTNDITWRAARLAAVTFPLCCHLAVEVSLGLPLEAGAS